MELATPLDGLSNGTDGGYFTKGGVGVGGADVAGGSEYFTHVLGEVQAVGIPCAVLLDGERTRGDGLGGVPRYQPKRGVVATGKVYTGNLQVTAVDVALMERYGPVGHNLFKGSEAHGVVCALDGGYRAVLIHARQVCRAVFRIIGNGPVTSLRLNLRLVAIGIKHRDEKRVFILANHHILVERIGNILP